ncbi:MAG: universal stress protein [Gammaproteobacteria bacterium]|nr:universal stress protein [Gammaproteobacteria bacterium]
MALKDLLVYVDDSKANAARVDAAVRLAADNDAHLTGLYIAPDQSMTTVYTEAHIPSEILEAQRQAAVERAGEARKLFEAAAGKAGLSSEWRFVEGDFVRAVSLHARYTDLLIIGQSNPSDELSVTRGAVEQILLDVGRPVLVIPYIGAPQAMGERVLVAWNASREAMRAVHDAMPLLERAKAVRVLSINPQRGPSGEGEVPGADISHHLARHNVKAEAVHVEAEDIAVGEVLLSRAADQQADLIVMGAYGHSRYRELILGGATRSLLEAMTIPVLMSH